ncbi:MarR family transcriptional regulator, partial [Paenibacillus sp. MCAF20]
VSAMQAAVIDAVKEKPGIQYDELLEATGLTKGSLSSTLKRLVGRKSIDRKGKKRNYKFFPILMEYVIVKSAEVRNPPPKEIEVPPDLAAIAAFELTEDQKLYIKGHMHIPRSELARRLGVPKLELNFALDRKR